MLAVCRLNALALDSSGCRCITGGQDRTAKLWSLPAGTPGMARSTSAGTGSTAAASRSCRIHSRAAGVAVECHHAACQLLQFVSVQQLA
jgi:hypothetical protein